MTPTTALLCLLALLFATTPVALAQTPGERVRTTDPRLARLVHEGVRSSSTFRRLIERLRHSDVVVYLECDGAFRPPGGRLTFVSSAGGHRYLHVRVSRLASPGQQLAIIGHELRHAVEIADAPAIVDGPSLAREYARMGHVNARAAGLSFDSDDAVETGYQVLGELRRFVFSD